MKKKKKKMGYDLKTSGASSFYLSSEEPAGCYCLLTIAGLQSASVRAGIRRFAFRSDFLCQGP